MRTSGKIATVAGKVLFAVLIGNLLFHVVIGLPFDMPYAVDTMVRGSLHMLDRNDLANADDMEVIVGLAVAIVTTAIGVAIVWGGHGLIRKWSARRSHA